MPKGKGKRLSEDQRVEIIAKLKKSDAPSKRAIAREYNVTENSIRSLWNNRDEIEKRSLLMTEEAKKNLFRLSSGKFEAIENELYIWIDALRRSKIEVPPSLAIMKAKEIAQKLNIKEEEFKASWQWLANFRRRRGLASMHLFGEGAEVNKDDPILLQQLEDLYSVIKMYRPENVYNMDETGLFFRLLPRYSLLMPTESLQTTRGKKKSKERVTLVVCSNATGSHKIPCTMIGKAARPACIVGRTWPIPYFCQKNAWMDVSICWKWFNEVFYPEVKRKTGLPVLLLLDNAPGHFEAFERNEVKVLFFPPNCTSWKQPCDMGIIAALKKRYKYLYLSDILSYYSLDDNTKECLKESSTLCKRGAAGVEYGKPAHLLDAAKYVDSAWKSIQPSSLKNCFDKADLFQISSSVDPEQCSEEADLSSFNMLLLLNEIKGIGNMISLEDIRNFESIDSEDSPTYIEAIMEDVEDCLSLEKNNDNVVAMDNYCDEEEANNNEIDDGTDFLGFEFIHLSLIDIGKQLKCKKAKAILKDENDKLMNSYEQLSSNIRSVIMKIKRERLQNALQPTIHDFFGHS